MAAGVYCSGPAHLPGETVWETKSEGYLRRRVCRLIPVSNLPISCTLALMLLEVTSHLNKHFLE